MSRNCFPFVPFILLLIAFIVTGALWVARLRRSHSQEMAPSSGDGLLTGMLLIGFFSLAAFAIYALSNVYPC